MKRMLGAVILVASLFGVAAPAAASNHTVMLDQSGSMNDFFGHPKDALRSFLKEIIQQDSVFAGKDGVSVLLFSEAGATVPSPQRLFTGDVAALRKDWAKVAPNFKALPQWTDLKHGLTEAITAAAKVKGDEPRIIWFLTDNVSEGEDARSRGDTLAFYGALKNDPAFAGLTNIQVFPLDLQHPTNKTGLMLYAMLWVPEGTPAAVVERQQAEYRVVTGALAKANLAPFMGQRPLLVKPLDASPFRLEVAQFEAEGKKPIPVSVKDGQVLLPGGLFTEGQPIRGTLTGRLVSNYETFKVPPMRLTASLSDPHTVDFNPVKPGLQKIDPDNLGEMGAQAESQPFQVRMEIPPMGASWNLRSVLTGTTGKVSTDLKLEATLNGTGGLQIDPSRITTVTFHNMTELPSLFAQDVRVLPVAVSVIVPVSYSGTRFWVAILVIALGVALVLGLLFLAWRLLARVEEWRLTGSDGSLEILQYRPWRRKHPVLADSVLLGFLVRTGPESLRFQQSDGGEQIDLIAGGPFTVEQDGRFYTFELERLNQQQEDEGDGEIA